MWISDVLSTGGRPRMRVVLAGFIAAITVLAGCANVEAPGSDGGTPSTVTIGQGVDPTTMDPLQQRETSTANVLRYLYDPLVTMDPKDPTRFLPGLADSWSMVDDVTYEFKLHPGVKFSDGSDLDSADVVYTVNYLLGQVTGDPTLISANFAGLSGATAVDPLTVRLTTSQPTPLLMPRLPGLFIIPDGADPASLGSTPVGTGPYSLKTWDRNAQVVLESRPDYFRGESIYPSIVFKTIPDDAARLSGLQSGDLDIIANLSPDSVAEVEGSGQAVVKQTPSARIASVWLNTLKQGPLQNPDVRLALNYAVDVDTIIKTIMGGYGTRVATMVPEYFAGYDAANKPIAFDPAKAKSLLAAAGYPDGFEMEMMLPAGRYPFAEEVAQAIQSYLKDVGVTLNLNIVEFGVFADATNSGNVPDSYFAAYGNSTFNPIAEYQIAVRTGNTGYALYSDSEMDTLIDQASATVDQGAQDGLISQIEQRMLTQAPFIYLYAQVDLYGVAQGLDWEPQMDEAIYLYKSK